MFAIQDDHPRTVSHARDHWWTLDFANALVSSGVNSWGELVPSPRAYAQNGDPRRWLGDNRELKFDVNFQNVVSALFLTWNCSVRERGDEIYFVNVHLLCNIG